MTRGNDIADERRILIARMVGAFGVSGEIKCQSFANPISQLLKYKPLIMSFAGKEQIIDELKGRVTAKGLVVRLPEITDRDAAQALHGAELWITRSQLPKPKDGEYYWVDLEGLRVVNREGVVFGTVSHLFETPANPILVVQGERERLIPFLMDRFIDAVDFEAGEIRVDWDADF
ncbi:MAG: ribosome maturation factor RimM [Arenimonas sp.]|nr:ribosome maturation factor RimM [Arenimonas sp.]MBP6310552.1 ribosome maturation factor RimM [Arenimonas sp.]